MPEADALDITTGGPFVVVWMYLLILRLVWKVKCSIVDVDRVFFFYCFTPSPLFLPLLLSPFLLQVVLSMFPFGVLLLPFGVLYSIPGFGNCTSCAPRGKQSYALRGKQSIEQLGLALNKWSQKNL